MTNTRKFLLAGAALALTATAALAANLPAKKSQPLPWMVQAVAFAGDAAPQFAVLQEGVAMPDAFVTPAFAFSAFADMTRMMAAMDRDMDRMMEQARAVMAMPDNLPQNAVLMNAPGANQDYSVTAIGTGGAVCGREVTITSTGNGSKPMIVSHSFGNCAASAAAPSQTRTISPHLSDPHLIQAHLLQVASPRHIRG